MCNPSEKKVSKFEVLIMKYSVDMHIEMHLNIQSFKINYTVKL